MKQDIIIRNMEIIGEAAKNIDTNLKQKYTDVEWRKASGMRNFLIHKYFEIDYAEVW